MSNVRDRRAAMGKLACAEMDLASAKKILHKHGVLNIGVPAIRELRDEE